MRPGVTQANTSFHGREHEERGRSISPNSVTIGFSMGKDRIYRAVEMTEKGIPVANAKTIITPLLPKIKQNK